MEIVVCLSRDLTLFSNMTYMADGGGFTHASLGLDVDAEYYYSFNLKGMKKEYRTSLKRKPRKMTRYIVEVPDEAGEKLKEIVSELLAQKEKFRYSKLSVSLRLLNLPNENPKEDAYFCSQFVAAVLKDSGCVPIKTDPVRCTPNDLLHELEDSGQIVRVEEEATLLNPGEAALNKAIEQVEKGHDKLVQTIDENMDPSQGINGKRLSAMALSLGLEQLNPLYDKMMNALGVAETAVGEAPEKLAQQTSSLLKMGTGKLMEAKDFVEDKLDFSGDDQSAGTDGSE